MRLEVYDGDELAALFVFGKEPEYYGVAGAHIRQLVTAVKPTYNHWTGEILDTGLREDTPEWLATTVSRSLYGTRYTITGFDVPEPPEFEGIP